MNFSTLVLRNRCKGRDQRGRRYAAAPHVVHCPLQVQLCQAIKRRARTIGDLDMTRKTGLVRCVEAVTNRAVRIGRSFVGHMPQHGNGFEDQQLQKIRRQAIAICGCNILVFRDHLKKRWQMALASSRFSLCYFLSFLLYIQAPPSKLKRIDTTHLEHRDGFKWDIVP